MRLPQFISPVQQHRPSLLGKIPAESDFVRCGTCAPGAATALEDWLSSSLTAARAARLEAPAVGQLAFVIPFVELRCVLVGLIVPSADRLGRLYPAVIFTSLDFAPTVRCYAQLPASCVDFLIAAGALSQRLPDLDLLQLSAELAQLPDPRPLQPAQARFEQFLRATPAASFLSRIFGHSEAAAAYGLLTCISAFGAVRGAKPAQGLLVDCPTSGLEDAMLWLELTKRLIHQPSELPSWFWPAGVSRSWMGLGSTPREVQCALANPDYESARFWPLTTKRDSALDWARQTLEPWLGGLESLTIHELFERLSRAERTLYGA